MPEVYREPVLGVHDLAPPEGRVTVELLDERGTKVLQRERADNAIMNHWNEAMKLWARGTPVAGGTVETGYDFDFNRASATAPFDYRNPTGNNWWLMGIQHGFPVWSIPAMVRDHMRNIILTDSTETVDADEWIFPGNIGAFCYLPETYTPSTLLKRATLDLSASYRSYNTLHYEAEWGTAYGNGTYNSVGIGGVSFTTTVNQAWQYLSVYPSRTGSGVLAETSVPSGGADAWARVVGTDKIFFGTNSPAVTSNVPTCSGHRVSDSEFWVLVSGVAGNNLTKLDLTTNTIQPFTAASAAAGISVTGPTMTTIGASTNRCGVAVTGTDLWLAYGTTLKRCVKPTNTALTVSNTYAPAGVGTLVDITTDGTNLYWLDATKVWVIDPTTGAVTSSWTHGLTGTMFNIAWSGAPNSRLYISYDATSLTAAVYNSSGSFAAVRAPIVTSVHDVTGTVKGSFAQNPSKYAASNLAQYFTSGLVMPLDSSNKHWAGFMGAGTAVSHYLDILGPSHLSRTVLGSPVVKTSSNAMRVIYEFGF